MIKLTLFNTLTIQLLDSKFLLRFVFDTSRVPFSFDLKLGLLYVVKFWHNSFEEFAHGKTNTVTDILVPFIMDLRLYCEKG